jgi:hypothetical protein
MDLMRKLMKIGIITLSVPAASCNKAEPYRPEKTIVVASRDIRGFELLDETNLTLASAPEEFVLTTASADLSEFRQTVALAPLRKGSSSWQLRR